MRVHPFRFGAMYALIFAAGFGSVLAVAAEIKAGTPPHVRHTHIRVSQGCVRVGCAQLGDSATYMVAGKVTDVSEPQPGVVCVQLRSSRQASQVCEPK